MAKKGGKKKGGKKRETPSHRFRGCSGMDTPSFLRSLALAQES